MICTVGQKGIEDFSPTNVLPQTSYWGRVKSELGYGAQGFELSVSKDLLYSQSSNLHKTGEDLLVLIRHLDQQHCYAYVPYGPKLEPEFENQGLFLEHVAEVLRPLLPANCLFLRFDLMWQNQWSEESELYDEEGNWTGPPESKTQELRLNYKTENWNLRKSPEDLLPKNTFFLDLQQSEEDLLRNMRYNTRYNVRKAQKQGIEVWEAGPEQLEDWYQLHVDTAIRQDIPFSSREFFETMVARQDEAEEGVQLKLLMAGKAGEHHAAMFLALSKTRGVYLYGASSSDRQQMLASYALQWEAIKTAKRAGCKEYDMFGSAPNLDRNHPLHGVHVYKKGFGGNLYHRMGCWDYPYNKEAYEHFRLLELSN